VVSLLYIVSQSWKQHAFVPAKWFFFYLSTMQEKNHCNSVATYMALLLILANGKANSIVFNFDPSQRNANIQMTNR
jgi:hypothetical protein